MNHSLIIDDSKIIKVYNFIKIRFKPNLIENECNLNGYAKKKGSILLEKGRIISQEEAYLILNISCKVICTYTHTHTRESAAI